jgi:hypothetical protein
MQSCTISENGFHSIAVSDFFENQQLWLSVLPRYRNTFFELQEKPDLFKMSKSVFIVQNPPCDPRRAPTVRTWMPGACHFFKDKFVC